MDVAFYDRTFRGRLIITGRDRLDLLHRLASNSLLGMEKGKGCQTCFCNPKGRMIDWSVVLDRGDDLLILSANPERLSGHIQQYTITEDVTVRNYMAIEIVLCGPAAAGLMGVQIEPWCHTEILLGEVNVQVARIEPLWGDAYAILAPDAVALRRELAEKGRALQGAEIDALRIRSGVPAYPNEINEDHNPWEAGLSDAISLTKGCYIGQEVIARLKTYDKVKRRLVGLRLAMARERGDPLRLEGVDVGLVTTVAGDLAMGYVETEHAKPGTSLDGAAVIALPLD
ncbi:MAG: CAF17-like 4Fe-4S cluster assembly/insertion protein YgfZ [Planctomycetota bacterium]|jgi:folate-binding protein YgfZ